MKDTIKLIVVLTLICAISSALLAAVFRVTEKPIAMAREQRILQAAAKVMPAGLPMPEKVEINQTTFFVAKKDGKVQAVATEGRSDKGYSGNIVLMIGMSSDGKLISYEVIQATETPGLGTKMTSDSFKKPLLGRPLTSEWKVKKDGGDVDAITAATISSRAVLDCICDAIKKRNAVLGQL